MQKNIDIHIANFQKKIVEKKKNNVGSISGAENETNLHKQIKILENRLDKANQKYNETIAINKELKGNIDSLRKQRIIFDNLYKKLENQLNEKKKIMAEIIEKANSSYEERDKANTKIQTLKDIAKKQASEFEKEIKDISTSIEKVKMSAFVKKNTRAKDTYSTIGQYFHEDDAASERVVRPSKTSSQRLEKIQKYRDDIAKIEAATSITNFDELLNIFAYNEEENFKSFKYMNEQSKEIEELEFEINQIKADMQNHTQSQNSIAKDAYLEAQEL